MSKKNGTSPFRKLFSRGPTYRIRRVFFILIFSMGMTFGSFTLIRTLFYHQSPVEAIIQTGPHYHAFPTSFFAETLGLSIDHPTSFHEFNSKKGEAAIRATGVVERVKIERFRPNKLYIDYTPRMPIAQLGDKSDTGIDAQGILFSLSPLYSPKKLPKIYLGTDQTLSNDKMQLIHHVLDTLEWVEHINLSKIDHSSLGQRQIVVQLKERLIRLTPKNYIQELCHYHMLEEKIFQKDASMIIVDLRTPDIAYFHYV